MTSPNATTPYHIDHEPNFLMQVHGEKDICLFDQNDREVLSEADIERFYCGDPQAATTTRTCNHAASCIALCRDAPCIIRRLRRIG